VFRTAVFACLVILAPGMTAAAEEIWFKVEYFEWEVGPTAEEQSRISLRYSVPAEAKAVATLVALGETGKKVASKVRVAEYEVGFEGLARDAKGDRFLVEVQPIYARLVRGDHSALGRKELMGSRANLFVKLGERQVVGGQKTTDTLRPKAKSKVSAWCVTVTKEKPKGPDDGQDE
jgi:hypothetical protein